MSDENKLLGAIPMAVDTVISLAEARIASILESRKKAADELIVLKAEHIAEFRKQRWNRWFRSKLSDEELWDEMTLCWSMYTQNVSDEYRKAERISSCGYDNQLRACKLSLAKNSSDGFVQVTDEGMYYLK